MRFIKYPKLTGSHRKEDVERIEKYFSETGLDDDWVALEKIHGANFAIYFDLSVGMPSMRVASRNQFVDDNFYSSGQLISNLVESSVFDRLLYRLTRNSIKGDWIVLYGELFGQGINKGVVYPAGRHFIPFDLRYLHADESREFFSHEAFNQHMEGLFTTPTVYGEGTLRECLQIDPDTLQSQAGVSVSKTFVNPPDNHPEGIVIRPRKICYMDGDFVAIKHKLPKFREVKRNRTRSKGKQNWTLEQYQDPNIMDYVTEARLDNVRSHLGDQKSVHFGRMANAFAIDVMREYAIENPDKADWKDDIKLEKQVRKQVALTTDLLQLVRKLYGVC